MNKTCYYNVLGLPRDCTPSEIKHSYRKLALIWHPDKREDTFEANQRFSEIQEAHGVLSDQRRKQIYDTYGHQGIERDSEGGETGTNRQNFFFQKGFNGTDKSAFDVLRDICSDKNDENVFANSNFMEYKNGLSANMKSFFSEGIFDDENDNGNSFFENYKPTFLDPNFSMAPPMFHKGDSFGQSTSFFSVFSTTTDEKRNTTTTRTTVFQSAKKFGAAEEVFGHSEKIETYEDFVRRNGYNPIFEHATSDSDNQYKQRAKEDSVMVLNDSQEDSPYRVYEVSGASTGCSVDELERDFSKELRISSKLSSLSSPSKKISKLKDNLSLMGMKKRSSKKANLR